MPAVANSFTLERIDPDTGALRRVTFTRGEAVKAFLRSGEYMPGIIVGVSHATKRARVRRYGQREGGIWFTFGAIYPLEPGDPGPPQPKVVPTRPLSSILDRVNARNAPPGGWGEADEVTTKAAPVRRAAGRKRRSPFGNEPPGGWTDADRVK